jgi:hypothetical protein
MKLLPGALGVMGVVVCANAFAYDECSEGTAYRVGETTQVAVGGSSAVSDFTNRNQKNLFQFVAPQAVYVELDAPGVVTPTATVSGSQYIPANTPVTYCIGPTTNIATLRYSVDTSLTISRMVR